MRCPHCGTKTGTNRGICPRCGRGLSPKRPPALHLYRDRRSRRWALEWLRLCAVAAGALLALILLISLVARLAASRPAPVPEATPTPQVTSEPTPTPEATPEIPLPPEDAVYAPIGSVATREDLVDLYQWMIASGSETVYLDSLTLARSDIADITDKYSNYFRSYNTASEPPAIRVEFKPGLAALHGLTASDTSGLSGDELAVAEQARAVVAEIIQPGMTDWEKELAVHDYVVNHCDYAVEATTAHTGDAIGFFTYGKCRCAGYLDTFRLLGKLAGLEVEMIGGPTTRDNVGSKGHAWLLVRLNGLWYVVDPTWDDLIEDEPTLEHTFFNVPFACFGGSRSWDEACLPDGELAQTLDENYYFNRPEYIASTVDEGVALAVRQLDAEGRACLMLPNADMAKSISAALVRHYGTKGSCYELSEDLNFNLFRFRLR